MKNKSHLGLLLIVIMTFALAVVLHFFNFPGVLVITLIIWVGLSCYLLFLDIRVSRLEKQLGTGEDK